jgi:predicted ATPase
MGEIGSSSISGGILVGREAELNAIALAFREGARVVSVEGAAGIGKTMLASMFEIRHSRTLDNSRYLLASAERASKESMRAFVSEFRDALRHLRGRDNALLVV